MNPKEQRDAFLEGIYRQHYKKLENMCLQYVGYAGEYRGIVDESVQDAFLQAVKDYEILRDYSPSRLDAWLTDTCMHRLTTALRTYRRRKKRRIYVPDDTELRLSAEQINDAIDAFLEQTHKRECIERLTAALNSREREILDKHLRQGLPFKEIAKQERTTVGAVKGVLARLRAKAKKAAAENPQDFFIIFVSILQLMRFIK